MFSNIKLLKRHLSIKMTKSWFEITMEPLPTHLILVLYSVTMFSTVHHSHNKICLPLSFPASHAAQLPE